MGGANFCVGVQNVSVRHKPSSLVTLVFARLPADSERHGEHLAGPPSHEDPLHSNVLLQELPQHREDQQLHQLPKLLPPEGACRFRTAVVEQPSQEPLPLFELFLFLVTDDARCHGVTQRHPEPLS